MATDVLHCVSSCIVITIVFLWFLFLASCIQATITFDNIWNDSNFNSDCLDVFKSINTINIIHPSQLELAILICLTVFLLIITLIIIYLSYCVYNNIESKILKYLTFIAIIFQILSWCLIVHFYSFLYSLNSGKECNTLKIYKIGKHWGVACVSIGSVLILFWCILLLSLCVSKIKYFINIINLQKNKLIKNTHKTCVRNCSLSFITVITNIFINITFIGNIICCSYFFVLLNDNNFKTDCLDLIKFNDVRKPYHIELYIFIIFISLILFIELILCILIFFYEIVEKSKISILNFIGNIASIGFSVHFVNFLSAYSQSSIEGCQIFSSKNTNSVYKLCYFLSVINLFFGLLSLFLFMIHYCIWKAQKQVENIQNQEYMLMDHDEDDVEELHAAKASYDRANVPTQLF